MANRIFASMFACAVLSGCMGYSGWYAKVKTENSDSFFRLVDWCKPGMRVIVVSGEWHIIKTDASHEADDARLLKDYPEYGAKTLTRWLSAHGCAVASGSGGQEALKELRLQISGATESISAKSAGPFKDVDYIVVVSGTFQRSEPSQVTAEAFRRLDGSGLPIEMFDVQVIAAATGATAFNRTAVNKYEEERVAKELAASTPGINR